MSEAPPPPPPAADPTAPTPTANTPGTEAAPTATTNDVATTKDAETGKGVAPPEERAKWGNQMQFILSCIGFAVGLGNIWRFPKLAYENGGGAFLVPYLICAFFFGLPMLYMEFTVGQYLSSGPSGVFKKYMPALSGIGWSMAVCSMYCCLSYNVIISWVVLYIIDVFAGNSSLWTRCGNSWNTEFCVSTIMDLEACQEKYQNVNRTMYFNGSCFNTADYGVLMDVYSSRTASPAAEYFDSVLMYNEQRTMGEFGAFNWQVALGLFTLWMLTVFALLKSVKYMGMISYLTCTVPYVIIVIMFIRGVTLDGADIGIRYYILEPDFSHFFSLKTWAAALTQICFSLSVGFGGLLAMSSYNPRTHNAFRDALIVVAADSSMSIFGGIACFSILGFLAKQRGVPLQSVISGGTGLAFVAYPEAMARMPAPWLWSLLFFFMLFLLGISSLIGLVEVFFTCIADYYPRTNKYKWVVCLVTGLVMSLTGFTMCFENGLIWFEFFGKYANFAPCVNALLEVMVVLWYSGFKNYIRDIRTMFGQPKNAVSKIFGPTGYWLYSNVLVTSPIFALAVTIFLIKENLDPGSVGSGYREYVLPDWTVAAGWFFDLSPLLLVPVFFTLNYLEYKKEGKAVSEMFTLHPTHPSYKLPKLKLCGNSEDADSNNNNNQSQKSVSAGPPASEAPSTPATGATDGGTPAPPPPPPPPPAPADPPKA